MIYYAARSTSAYEKTKHQVSTFLGGREFLLEGSDRLGGV